MTTVYVEKAIIRKNFAVFRCNMTSGRRNLTFEVEVPRPLVPTQVVSRIQDFALNILNPGEFVDVDPWEGFEIEV